MASGFNFTKETDLVFKAGSSHVPAFILDAGEPLIIDPGVSAFGPLYLRELDKRFKDCNRKSLLMLLTHSHFDHCGAAPYLLRHITGARVGCSMRAADVLQKEKAIDLICRFNAEYEQRMKKELAGEDTTFTALPVALRLQEGDRLELADGTDLHVYETPGHTRDCLSYFWAEHGLLFAGEAAGVPETDFIHSVFLSDYQNYVASIKKIRNLAPHTLCIAHVGILRGTSQVKSYLDKSLEASQRYRSMLEQYLLRYNDDIEKVVEQITCKEYDTRTEPIINRNPYITNLRAKINAVLKLRTS